MGWGWVVGWGGVGDGWAEEMGSQEKKDTRPVGKTPCSLKTEIVHPKTRNALHHVGD